MYLWDIVRRHFQMISEKEEKVNDKYFLLLDFKFQYQLGKNP